MASVEKEIKVTPKSASKVTPALSKSSGPQYRSPVTSAKKKAASNKVSTDICRLCAGEKSIIKFVIYFF